MVYYHLASNMVTDPRIYYHDGVGSDGRADGRSNGRTEGQTRTHINRCPDGRTDGSADRGLTWLISRQADVRGTAFLQIGPDTKWQVPVA